MDRSTQNGGAFIFMDLLRIEMAFIRLPILAFEYLWIYGFILLRQKLFKKLT